MKEVLIGIRLSRETGVSFFGITEVNEALRTGACITALKEGDGLFSKVGEDAANVRLVLSGCTIKVILSEEQVSGS